MEASGWLVRAVGEPMVPQSLQLSPEAGQVLVAVAGCGVCHTDLGFYFDGVPTRHPLPLVLGHEVAGVVQATGAGAEEWLGRQVVVPAVIPCGECPACRAGHGSICPAQVFPGNDVHGGFASHLVVPAQGLCPVPDLNDVARNPAALDLPSLAVIADAVSTPYQALLRSGLEPGDLAVFVGAGGVGGFGAQLAAAMGAHVVAVDTDGERLEKLADFGVELGLCASDHSPKEIKRAVREFAGGHEIPTWRRCVFETSGAPAGQELAFSLLTHGAYLSVVGYSPAKVTLRLSNLMAFDARMEGNWGCLPEHYPAVVELALSGAIRLEPFVERRPLATINETFAELHQSSPACRIVLIPES